MRRDLLRPLERLEQHIGQVNLSWLHIALTSEGPESGPGERIVADWLSADNGILMTHERVTVDPNDEGKRFWPKLV